MGYQGAVAVKPFDVADLKTWTCGKCRMTFKVGVNKGTGANPEPHLCPDCGQHFYSGQAGGLHAALLYIDKHPWGYE